MSKFVEYLKETAAKDTNTSDIEDQWVDIISSGSAGDFSGWHKKELSALIKQMTPEQKTAIWKKLYNVKLICSEEGPYEEELSWVQQALGTKLSPSDEKKIQKWYDSDEYLDG